MMATLPAYFVSNFCQDAPETKRYALAMLELQFHVRLYRQQGRPNTPRLAVCLSRDP